MSKETLIAIRDQLQTLLDNYQVTDVAMVPFKSALVQLNDVIETPAAAPVSVAQPITSTADVVAGVLAGLSAPLSSLAASISALTPQAPTPAVLAPSADQIAAAQAVIAAAAASAPALSLVPPL